MAVALQVVKRTLGLIDRDLVEVRPAQPLQLGVLVGEQPPLQQRVIGEVDAGDHVRGAEGHLLGFGEEVVRVAVEHHPPDHPQRDQLLRHQLGGVQHVEIEPVRLFLAERLDRQLPFGEIPGRDGVPEVAAMEVRIGAVDLQRLVPHD